MRGSEIISLTFDEWLHTDEIDFALLAYKNAFLVFGLLLRSYVNFIIKEVKK